MRIIIEMDNAEATQPSISTQFNEDTEAIDGGGPPDALLANTVIGEEAQTQQDQFLFEEHTTQRDVHDEGREMHTGAMDAGAAPDLMAPRHDTDTFEEDMDPSGRFMSDFPGSDVLQ